MLRGRRALATDVNAERFIPPYFADNQELATGRPRSDCRYDASSRGVMIAILNKMYADVIVDSYWDDLCESMFLNEWQDNDIIVNSLAYVVL